MGCSRSLSHASGFAAALTAAALMVAAGASAESPTRSTPHGVVEQSLGASYGPAGLQHVLGLRWTRRLTVSPRPLLSDAHVSAGVSHTLTPSYMRASAWAEVAPLSILAVRGGVEPGVYFGTFGSLMSFAGYDSAFADEDRRARRRDARAGTGARAYLSPAVKLAVGSFAVASTVSVEWWRASAGPFFYEPSRDTLLRSRGDRLVSVSTVVVRRQARRGGGRLTYGVSYDLSELPNAPDNRSRRIGLLLVRESSSKHFGLQSPSLGVRVGYFVSDPYRRGRLSGAVGISIDRKQR